MSNPVIDSDYLLKTLADLLNIPSPTGRAEAAIAYCEQAMLDLGLSPRRTPKGVLTAEWAGVNENAPRALTAHADTLGAMVKEIKSCGRLKLSALGDYAWNTVEGEGCSVFTNAGRVIRGSLLLVKSSGHVHGTAVRTTERDAKAMEVRLDECTSAAEETRAFGIEVGDFVAFDPRQEMSESGFIRSRHLDDKAGIACVLAAVQAMQREEIKPAQRTTLHISNYEEVGHGAATGFPTDLFDLVAVDMAAVGEGQTSDEFHVTICAKDSDGPYHTDLTNQLRSLAQTFDIPHKVDIYPYYGSDAEAYWRAGGDVRVALIGPGVDASHNYERTHVESLLATTRLIVAYLV